MAAVFTGSALPAIGLAGAGLDATGLPACGLAGVATGAGLPDLPAAAPATGLAVIRATLAWGWTAALAAGIGTAAGAAVFAGVAVAGLAGLIHAIRNNEIPVGSLVTATLTGHGLKDPDTAIKAAGGEPLLVPGTMDAVAAALGI